jgi:hypothetical protein
MITPSAMDKEYLASPGRGGELHPAAQGRRIESQDTTGKVMRHFAEPDCGFLVAFGVGGRSLRIFSSRQCDGGRMKAGSSSSSQAITYGTGEA